MFDHVKKIFTSATYSLPAFQISIFDIQGPVLKNFTDSLFTENWKSPTINKIFCRKGKNHLIGLWRNGQGETLLRKFSLQNSNFQ